MNTTATAKQVRPMDRPLEVGQRVKIALYFRPLVMCEGTVIEVIAPEGEWKTEWCYRVEYTYKGHQAKDLIDHTDPTLYLI